MKVELRDPNIIMKLSRLGSFHQSKLSFLRSFRFCLDNASTEGPSSLESAKAQHSAVSIESQGLKTFKLGISLNEDKCSIG